MSNFFFVVFMLTRIVLDVRCWLDGPKTPSNHFTESEIDTLIDIYYQFCTSSEKCDGNIHVPGLEIPIPNITIYCYPTCSCEALSCQAVNLKETCCPELLNEITRNPYANAKCIHPQLKPWNPNLITTNPRSEAFLMEKCSVYQRANLGDEIADKCDFSYQYTNLDTRVPVTLMGLSDTYPNAYCALCNGLNNNNNYILPWTPIIHCSEGTFQVAPVENIVERLLQSEHCTLYFVHPKKDTSHLMSCGNLISECNITGRWRVYDPLTEAACTAFRVPFQDVYRNVFCYLCNSDGSLSDMPTFKPGYRDSPSYSVVLKYPIVDDSANDTVYTNVSPCKDRGVFDPFQDLCLNVTCLLQKVYVGEERCENIVEKIGGEIFKVFLKFTPQTMLPSHISVFEKFITQITVYTENILKEASLNDFVNNYGTTFKKHFNTIVYFLGFFSIHLPTSVLPSEMVDIAGIDDILTHHERYILFENGNGDNVSFLLEFDTVDSILESESASIFGSGNLPLTKDDFETLLPVHKCPVVELDSSFYNSRHGRLLSVSNDRISTQINRNAYIQRENEIVICLESFQSLIDKFYEEQKQTASGNAQTLTILLPFLSLFLQVLK